MTNVPRRLPPTQGQRIRNVTVTHASLSGQGRTAAARPVPQQRPVNRIYQPPVAAPDGTVVTGTASGDSPVSISSTMSGSGTSTATGSGAVAIGQYSQATNMETIAIGLAQASGNGGIAIGWNALATGSASVAVGTGGSVTDTWAAGSNSVAVGSGAQAGNEAVAIGHGAQAADGQIALGNGGNVVLIRGSLCLADSSNGLHRLVVSTSGALSTVAYP